MSEYYNEALKNEYLNSIENEGSRQTIQYVFAASKSAEIILNKDLYNFSKEEIELVLRNMSFRKVATARANTQYIKIYIRWCIKHGYRDDNLPPLSGIKNDFYEKLVTMNEKIHYSKEEFFKDIVEELDNSQDQALLSLCWFGVSGEKFSEIRGMHYNHINWNENKIDVYDENGKYNRTVTFEGEDIRVMRYVQRAYEDNTYRTMKEDGEYNEKELLRSDYIFRNQKSPRAREGELINFAVLYTRLKAIREELNIPYLTPNSIRQSSMIYDAVQLYLRDGEFGIKQRNEIGDKFKLPTIINTNGKEYYNPALMTFINPENIKSLYNIDIKM